MEDIVITSYKQQIKESSLKADAIKSGGFDIVIEELEKRQVKTSKIKDFFSKIVNSYTMDDLNKLTLDDLEEVISDINQQVTQLLIAKVEIADAVIRKSKLVALAKSPDGKVSEKDNYVLVGNNLAKEINNDGVASGLELCIRNYCSQKIYQANYREKMVEKEKELGIYDEEERNSNKALINEKMNEKANNLDPKHRLLFDIFNRDIEEDENISFEKAKDNYHNAFNIKMKNLGEYK